MARLAAARGRRRPGRTCRSCTPSTAAGTCRSGSSTTCPGTPARGRSGSATAPSSQRQTDVLGEVMVALHLARERGLDDDRGLLGAAAGARRRPRRALGRARQRAVGDPRPAAALHALAGDGLGRVRPGGPRRARSTASTGPVERWRELRDQVRAEVLERGVDRSASTFTQHYDTTEVDASLLVLPPLGFIAGDDPLMLGTIAAIEEDLMRDGLLLRYRTETGVDGLAGDENPFLACSFWLVSAYARGRPRRRRRASSRPAAGAAQRRRAARRGVRPRRPDGTPATSRRRSRT